MDDESLHGKDRCQSSCGIGEGSICGANHKYHPVALDYDLASCLIGCVSTGGTNQVAITFSSKDELAEEIEFQEWTFRGGLKEIRHQVGVCK